MRITVTDKGGKVSTGTGGGFIHNHTGWDGTTVDLVYHLDHGDGSGTQWSLDELATINIELDGGEEG